MITYKIWIKITSKIILKVKHDDIFCYILYVVEIWSYMAEMNVSILHHYIKSERDIQQPTRNSNQSENMMTSLNGKVRSKQTIESLWRTNNNKKLIQVKTLQIYWSANCCKNVQQSFSSFKFMLLKFMVTICNVFNSLTFFGAWCLMHINIKA